MPVILGYGNLAFPLAFLGYPLVLFLHPYYAADLGLGLAAVSTVLLVTRIFDFVTDPLIGWMSDHTRSRIGRRRPFVFVGVPVTLLGVWKLFFPEAPVDFWYMLIWNTVMYLGWTMIVIPYGAWGAELSGDYLERSRIMSFRQMFTIVGLIGSAAVIWVSQQWLDKAEPGEVLDTLGSIVLLVLPMCVVLMILLVPEPPRANTVEAQVAFAGSIFSMLKVGPFRRLVYMGLAVVAGEASRHSVSYFFIHEILQAGDRIGFAYTAYFVFGVMAIPLWQWLAKRYGKHRALAIAMANGAITSLATFGLGPGDFNLFFVLFVVKGLSIGGFAYLPLAMIADVVDVDRAKNRQQRAGMFYAFHAAMDKIGTAFGLFIALQLLNLAGYDPEGLNTTATGLLAVRVEYAVLPGLFFLLATAIIWNYPLTQERHQALRSRLKRRDERERKIAA